LIIFSLDIKIEEVFYDDFISSPNLGMFRISLFHVGGFLIHARQPVDGVHEGGLLALKCPLRGRPVLHHARCEAFIDLHALPVAPDI
jgi:hypothetical protein